MEQTERTCRKYVKKIKRQYPGKVIAPALSLSNQDHTRLFLNTLIHGTKSYFVLGSRQPGTGAWNDGHYVPVKPDVDVFEYINEDRDSYVTVSPMKSWKRSVANCKGVNAMQFDIDVFHSLVPYDTKLADEVCSVIIAVWREHFPEPTMIVSTGRGLCMIYCYENLLTETQDIALHDTVFPLMIRKAQELFDEDFVDIDSCITDHARTTRLPGTKNTKADRFAVLCSCSGIRYDQRQLYAPFDLADDKAKDKPEKPKHSKEKPKKEKKDKTNDKPAKTGQAVSGVKKEVAGWVKRACRCWVELMEQISGRKKLVEGSGRNNFIFAYYCCCLHIFSAKEAKRKATVLNASMTEPLEEAELYRIFASADKKKAFNGGYIFSLETLCLRLPLIYEECEELGFFKYVIRKKEYAEHQKNAYLRDQCIISLWYKDPKATIAGVSRYLKAHGFKKDSSEGAVRATLDRLRIRNRERDLDKDPIDWEKEGRYCSMKEGREKAKRRRQATIYAIQKKAGKDSENSEKILFAPFWTPDGLEESSDSSQTQATNRKGQNCDIPEVSTEDLVSQLLNGKDTCIQGAAGTGKTTLLTAFMERIRERGGKVLPISLTACTSTNLHGRTIHRALHIPVPKDGESIDYNVLSVKSHQIDQLEDVQAVIVDEIGMVDAALLHYIIRIIDEAESYYRYPIQLVCAGDFRQLAPIGNYAFHNSKMRIWGNVIVLDRVYRQQQDLIFANTLNAIACGNRATLSYINNNAKFCYQTKDILDLLENEKAVYLGSYRNDIDRINKGMVERHRQDPPFRIWKAKNRTSPLSEIPVFEGMKVMFNKNTDRFSNGTRGIIREVYEKYVVVEVNGDKIQVGPELIRDKNRKTLKQLPFVPAYAITIHKSQGLTLDKVVLNPSCFAPGQLYTALSRVRSLDDLVLTRSIQPHYLICSDEVNTFLQHAGRTAA